MDRGSDISDNNSPWRALGLTFSGSVAVAVVLGALVVGAAGSLADALTDGPPGAARALRLQNPHVVVVKSSRTLYLFDGGELVRTFSVKLGPHPAGQKLRAGDGRTPEGRFRVCTKNANSPNHRFLGIDYPDLGAVERGLAVGLISDGEGRAIREAIRAGRCPSWTTALGGGIGLHGSASTLSETAGCIALADARIAELFEVLRIGDAVEILP